MQNQADVRDGEVGEEEIDASGRDTGERDRGERRVRGDCGLDDTATFANLR
jgi:hypothetical protein